MNDVLTLVLAQLPIGGARIGAEVCIQWKRICAGILHRCLKHIRQHKGAYENILRIPVELRYYLLAPGLLKWAIARFDRISFLRAFLNGESWLHELGDLKYRALVAAILRHGLMNPVPGTAFDVGSACQLASELIIAGQEKRKSRIRDSHRSLIKYSPADHRYFKLLNRIQFGNPGWKDDIM